MKCKFWKFPLDISEGVRTVDVLHSFESWATPGRLFVEAIPFLLTDSLASRSAEASCLLIGQGIQPVEMLDVHACGLGGVCEGCGLAFNMGVVLECVGA